MLTKEQHMEAYRQLTASFSPIWDWKYDEHLRVISSSCDHESLFHQLMMECEIEKAITKHRVQYDLERADGGVRVLIRQTGPCGQNVFACRLRGISVGWACALVRYLYENGVEPPQAGDMLRDLCGDLAVCED